MSKRIKNNSTKRSERRWCVEKLAKELDFSKVKSFLEPCSGDDRIVKLIEDIKINDPKFSTHWCEIKKGKNYFGYTFNVDLVITNPPFELGIKFLEKSLIEAKTVCYLLPLNYLGSLKRKDFWNGNEPNYLFTVTPRPSFSKELSFGNAGTGSNEYGWFIWDSNFIVKTAKIFKVL